MPPPPPHVGALCTATAAAETIAAKDRTPRFYRRAGAVDMETAWIAVFCVEHNLPILSLRVISDAADQPFPVPGHVLFDAAHQRPRYFALSFYLLLHPAYLFPFVRFVRGLTPARARLTHALTTLIRTLP